MRSVPRTQGGRLADERAAPVDRLNQPALSQDLRGAADRPAGDLVILGQLPLSAKAGPGRQLPGRDAGRDVVGDAQDGGADPERPAGLSRAGIGEGDGGDDSRRSARSGLPLSGISGIADILSPRPGYRSGISRA